MSEHHTIYWPGTNIIKSQGNAFTDWKAGGSRITNTREWRTSQAAQLSMAGSGGDVKKQFVIYSKARRSA